MNPSYMLKKDLSRWAGGILFVVLAPSLLAQSSGNDHSSYAMSHAGNPELGRLRFTTQACAQCHSLDGGGSKVGPDLSAIGDKYQKEDLIRSITEPSASIAVGYDHTILTRKDGSVVSGVIKQATADWIELMNVAGERVRVKTQDIEKQETAKESLMPQNLHQAGTPEDFTNLIAYLGTLHQNLAGKTVADVPKAGRPMRFESLFDDKVTFREPIWFGEFPSKPDSYIVLEHDGHAWMVTKKPSGDERLPFLDLSKEVRTGGATGLLAMAFHPKFPADLRYFLKYQIIEAGKISTLLMERRFKQDLSGDSGEPARQLLKIPATTQDHNGGSLGFGPDGYLYLGMGDTGPQEDPQGHSQNLSLLLGKILRLDVDRQDEGLPYAIPKNNPFRKVATARPEIYAYGFREPWRFSWDMLTKDFWVGDVGQNDFEEVGIVRAGENHGWNVFEGSNPFSEKFRKPGVELVPPVWSYSHRLGVSVTGGYVYRGKKAPDLAGWYICADYESRRIWALTQQDRKLGGVIEIGQAPSRAVSFSQFSDGEIYLAGFNSGKIYRLALEAVDLTPLVVKVIAPTSEASAVMARITTKSPEGDWMALDYDDSKWSDAPGGYGAANTPGAVIRTEWKGDDIWLRRTFTLPETLSFNDKSQVSLRIHHDEDAEVFINGTEVAKLPRWTQNYTDLPLSPEAIKTLRPGRNVMSIHCRQIVGGQYIDAGLIEFVPQNVIAKP